MHVEINLEIDRPRLHAVQFAALIAHYLEERGRYLDPATIKSYRLRLRHFTNWWNMQGPLREWYLDEPAFAEYFHYVQALKHIGWSSKNDALRRLRQLLHWAHQRSYVAVDFAEFVPTMKGSAPPRLPVELSALSALLEACDDTDEPERNRAMLAVLAGTGVRCEECCTLRVEKVVVYEDGSGLITLSVAKNDKLRTVAFDPLTGTYLCEWIVMLPYNEGPLFPSRVGRNSGTPLPITTSGQRKLFRRIAGLADVADQVQGPHDLRRLFGTTWAKIVPEKAFLLQRQMGHAHFNTTLKYILGGANEVREEISQRPITPVSVVATKQKAPGITTPTQFIFGFTSRQSP